MDKDRSCLHKKSKDIKECDRKESTAINNKIQNGERMIAGR